MNRLPIRLRLTVVFALAMAIVLSLAGWLVYARVATSLDSALDEQLRARAQDVSALVRRDGSLKSTGGALIEHGGHRDREGGRDAQADRQPRQGSPSGRRR